MTNLFFVYGTLKKNFHNNVLLDGCKFLGKGVTDDGYIVHGKGFPKAVRYSKGCQLAGEVYEVTDKGTVQRLDWLEGNGSFYLRSKRMVTLESKEKGECWIYEYIAEPLKQPARSITTDVLDWDYDYDYADFFTAIDVTAAV